MSRALKYFTGRELSSSPSPSVSFASRVRDSKWNQQLWFEVTWKGSRFGAASTTARAYYCSNTKERWPTILTVLILNSRHQSSIGTCLPPRVLTLRAQIATTQHRRLQLCSTCRTLGKVLPFKDRYTFRFHHLLNAQKTAHQPHASNAFTRPWMFVLVWRHEGMFCVQSQVRVYQPLEKKTDSFLKWFSNSYIR